MLQSKTIKCPGCGHLYILSALSFVVAPMFCPVCHERTPKEELFDYNFTHWIIRPTGVWKYRIEKSKIGGENDGLP